MKSISLKELFLFLCLFIGYTRMIFKPFDHKIKLIVVLKSHDSSYWDIVEAGVKKAFDDFHIEGEIMAPSFDSNVEIQNNLLEVA